MHGAAGVWAGRNVVQVKQNKKQKPSRRLGVVYFRVYRVIFNVGQSFFPINFHFFVLNFILVFFVANVRNAALLWPSLLLGETRRRFYLYELHTYFICQLIVHEEMMLFAIVLLYYTYRNRWRKQKHRYRTTWSFAIESVLSISFSTFLSQSVLGPFDGSVMTVVRN